MGRAKKNVEVEAQVIARGNVVPMMTETESEETVQYVSDEDAAREDRLVSEIRMITEQTKQVVLFNSNAMSSRSVNLAKIRMRRFEASVLTVDVVRMLCSSGDVI